MLLGQKPDLKREPRGVGSQGNELGVLGDDADLRFHLLADDVAEDAALFLLVIVLAAVHFLAHALGHDWQRNQLRMGVLERRPGSLAVVLENQDVTEALVIFQVEDAVAIGPQHLFDGSLGHRGQRALVIRRFDDHFVRPDTVHAVKQSLALAIEVAFDAQRRELVRDDADSPTGAIPRAAVAAVGQDLGRRLRLIAVAKRAKALPLDLYAFANEVGRPLRPVGRDDHPSTGDGIFAKFRQNFLRGLSQSLAHSGRIIPASILLLHRSGATVPAAPCALTVIISGKCPLVEPYHRPLAGAAFDG